MNTTSEQKLWVFCGKQALLPSGVFLDFPSAEHWIKGHSLTGTLTGYPANQGVFEWAIERGFFKPAKDYQRASKFIGQFTSAHLEHYHYENGKKFENSATPQNNDHNETANVTSALQQDTQHSPT